MTKFSELGAGPVKTWVPPAPPQLAKTVNESVFDRASYTANRIENAAAALDDVLDALLGPAQTGLGRDSDPRPDGVLPQLDHDLSRLSRAADAIETATLRLRNSF